MLCVKLNSWVWAAVLYEHVVGGDPFAVLLADDFLTDYEPVVTADLAEAFASRANHNFR